MKPSDAPLQAPTALWLMLGLSLGALPHFFYQPWWVSIIFVVMLSWRVLHYWRGWPVPSPNHRSLRWLLSGLAAACLLLLFSQYGTTIGRDAGVALLVMMLGMKIVEIHNQRDIYISCYLGYFLIITNFFYNQSMPVLLLMVVVVTIMTTSLISLHAPPQLHMTARFKLAGNMLLLALPVTLLLFVLFPRVAGPLWGLPQDAHQAVTGMDDKMTLGNISRLIQSDAIAFRVRFDNAIPPPSQLYWRGPVLWRSDGITWHELNQFKQRQQKPSIAMQGEAYDYTLTIEPHNKHWLFALDMPQADAAGVDAFMTEDGQLRSKHKIQQRKQYHLVSYPDYRFNAATEPLLQTALQLPQHRSPKTVALAQQWRRQIPDDQTYIQHVLQFFHQQNFYYTLTPPPINGDQIDGFLFGSKRGFCEHYAASFTVLMRAAGIPTRIVTGYLGGEINPVDGLLVVRQRDAHAWAEVWLSGQGWVRVDPTAAVSQARVEHGISDLLPAERRSPLLIARSDMLVELWQQLRNNWDALNSAWDMWVLAYGPQTQKQLLSLLGMENPDWQKMISWLVVSLTLISLLIMLFLFYQRRPIDPLQRDYQRFCSKLARLGIARHRYEGPLDFAARAKQQLPAYSQQIDTITQLYIAVRYQEQKQLIHTLHQTVSQFRPAI